MYLACVCSLDQSRRNGSMTRVRQLPRIALTWGLMLLSVIAGGVRPSCICSDGTLCVLCPKLMAAQVVSPSTEAIAPNGSCSSKSCCCEHATKPVRSDATKMSESPCDGCDCFAVPSAVAATVQKVEASESHLDSDVVPAMLPTFELGLSHQLSLSTGSSHRVGPPPLDLIVLYQRWLI